MWRRLAVAVLAAVVAASSCAAEAPVVFDLSIRGIRVGTLRFSGEAAGGRYAVSGRLESAGLAGLVRRVRYDGQAEGSLRQGRFTPARYREQADTGRRQSQSVMEYRRGIPQVKVYNPPRDLRSDGIDPATQGGTVDPLTALFATLRDVPPGKECNKTLTMFDGKRRSQLVLGPPAAVTGGVVCPGEYRRLAGFSATDMAEKARFPFTLRLGLAQSGLMQVKDVTMESIYGNARLKRR
ncbi:MAG: DUF3108 domain-containing protein [Rhodobacter sp.]|jgi:hypothetical protein|nr:DUF3108 domain-containing protein [Rhodobacter sp.]